MVFVNAEDDLTTRFLRQIGRDIPKLGIRYGGKHLWCQLLKLAQARI